MTEQPKFIQFYAWTLEKRWRTWIGHGLLALALAPWFGAWTVMFFYAMSEVKELIQEKVDNKPTDMLDHIMDASVPFLFLGLSTLWPGW